MKKYFFVWNSTLTPGQSIKLQQNPSKPRASEHGISVEFVADEFDDGTAVDVLGVVDCGLGSGVI